MTSFNALVIGAGSSIAQVVITQLIKDSQCASITAVSRLTPEEAPPQNSKLRYLTCDNSEQAIEDLCQRLIEESVTITKVLICNGVLHTDTMMPEKKLEDISALQLEATFHANTITPMLWLSRLLPVLSGTKEATQVTVFSARVGSISDNKMGGWYSYRASKAALNMLVKTCAVEYARRAKNVKLIAFHPGTTDTPLSKPFQRSVAKEKLFTTKFVAEQILSIMDNVEMDNEAVFLDWNNQAINW